MNKLSKIKSKLGRSFWFRSIFNAFLWLKNYPKFIYNLVKFKVLSNRDGRFKVKFIDTFPCLFDNTKKTGFDPHYTYHPAWAVRTIAKINPSKHIDISSILHFSTLLSAFIPTEFYDYRPAEIQLDGLACKKGDLTDLPFEDDSVESISCMHTIEHVGLGRYGDPMDIHGDIKSAKELRRVVKKGGSLILVVPMGKPKIEFNAHRIYSYDQVIEMFKGLELKEFSLIPDNFKETGLIKNADKSLVEKQDWACGCFWFIK